MIPITSKQLQNGGDIDSYPWKNKRYSVAKRDHQRIFCLLCGNHTWRNIAPVIQQEHQQQRQEQQQRQQQGNDNETPPPRRDPQATSVGHCSCYTKPELLVFPQHSDLKMLNITYCILLNFSDPQSVMGVCQNLADKLTKYGGARGAKQEQAMSVIQTHIIAIPRVEEEEERKEKTLWAPTIDSFNTATATKTEIARAKENKSFGLTLIVAFRTTRPVLDEFLNDDEKKKIKKKVIVIFARKK